MSPGSGTASASTTTSSPSSSAGASQTTAAQAATAARPFTAGVQSTDVQQYDVTTTLTAGTQALDDYEIKPTGFLNRIWLWVVATATGNTASVAFSADGPTNAIDSLQFLDTNSKPIYGPFTGWDVEQVCKYGGYTFSDDIRLSPNYSAVTGTGANGGSFSFFMTIPLEIVPRDALGSLVNKSASTPYTVKITLAATSTIYTTAPTTAPSLRIRMAPESYWEPDDTDAQGNPLQQAPPAEGVTQYWQKVPYTLNAGWMNPLLTQSTGALIRNLMFVLRDANQSRTQGEADWPDPLTFQVDVNQMFTRSKGLWIEMMTKWFGYTGATFDAPGAKTNGLYLIPFNMDFFMKPGWENRRRYLATPAGLSLTLDGTIGGSGTHTLTVYTNKIALPAATTLASITT